MMIRFVFICLFVVALMHANCVTEEPTRLTEEPTRLIAKINQGNAKVTVSCKLEHKHWTIGQPLSFTAEVENRGETDVHVFDPMHDMIMTAKMTSMRVTRLELLDRNKRLIGDLFAREGGSDLPRHKKHWLAMPPNGICQSKIRCHHAGYVPRTRFIKGREIPPDTYYLRLVVMDSFFLSNYQKDPKSQKRLAESELIRIELLPTTEPSLVLLKGQ